MAKPNSKISDNISIYESTSSSVPFRNLLQKSKQKGSTAAMRRSRIRSDAENIVPIDPNIQIADPPLSASTNFPKNFQSKVKIAPRAKDINSPLVNVDKSMEAPDQHVKVAVRIKPVIGLGIGETSVREVSNDSVFIGEKKYSFDSVFNLNATQEDVYRLIGAPLVKDALAGYNTSIVAYGQTGSGKTYTMWGPPSAMVESPLASGPQGIVPRIFQDLFSEIQKDQANSDGKHVNYQCRCSFLEVYDEKIGDLLDPTQRDLEIKDEFKNGFYVENLTEEYVTCYDDITQILIKGLSNRRTGATSINSKSSRSHIIFTCIIESWCKDSSSKCFGSSKTSRINLVDLAGYERNLPADANKQYTKEGKYVKKSTSQLGRLLNILAQRRESGKSDEVPYRSSRLTQLLRETFGGNAKLSIICTVTPDNKNIIETLSTLRFGQKAKLMKNEPVINVITEDDVDDLSDQIRHLKEELMRAKSSTYSSFNADHGYFRGGNMRESLNQLRLSLNRSVILPSIDNDPDENICIEKDDMEELRRQIDSIHASREYSEHGDSTMLYSAEGCETEFTCEHYLSCSEASENEETNSSEPEELSKGSISVDVPLSNLAIDGFDQSSVLQDPVPSESPKIKNIQRKSLVLASTNPTIQNGEVVQRSKNMDVTRQSHQTDQVKSSLRSSTLFTGPTVSLANSLQRGLQIIDSHQRQSSTPTRSSVSFSFEHFALKPCLSSDKADASVQTSPEGKPSHQPSAATFVCVKCQEKVMGSSNDIEDKAVNSDKSADQAPEHVNKDLALAIEKEKELSWKDQAAEIERLNKLLEQCKCRVHRPAICVSHSSDNISSVESQLQSIKEDKDEMSPPTSENKLLTWKDDDKLEAEVIKAECEIKEITDSVRSVNEQTFSSEEREELLREIEFLRKKMQLYADTPGRTTDELRSSLLSKSIHLRKSSAALSQANNGGEEFEKERQRWMEMESDWISLTDELRIEIESNRQRAEQVEMELRLEKTAAEELDDALKRSVVCQARMVEHFTELQENYNDIVEKHRAIMAWIAEVKRAASKAGVKGRHGTRYAKALSNELSSMRVERERERDLLKKENRSLKIQLKDTAEALHAAGQVLVRLKEAEEAASRAEEKNLMVKEENEKLKKQIEKLKRKHKMEMISMKLPESALGGTTLYSHDMHDESAGGTRYDDDQAWRAEFGAIYQEHY